MRLFYFVGGPAEGQKQAFARRLAEVGGPPLGWQIYPHAAGDGKALHVVASDDERSIAAHLSLFGAIYQRGPILEITPASPLKAGATAA